MIRDDRVTPAGYDDPVYRGTAVAPLLKRISWGAILAGVVLALVVSLMLSLLGTAIGSASIDPMQEADPLAAWAKAPASDWV